jgi:hypothetical protein
VKIGLGPEATVIASHINYLQVNVLFDPLTAAQRQRQQQRRAETIREQAPRPTASSRGAGRSRKEAQRP